MTEVLRMTHQRELILKELGNCHNHPTADELYERVKKELPRISLATVYRNLEILSENGMISKVEISGRQKRFDFHIRTAGRSYHMQCRGIEDINFDQKQLSSLEKKYSHGYTISGCRVEFFGVCPKCQAKNEKEQAEKGQDDCKSECSNDSCQKTRLSERQRIVLEVLAASDEICANKDIAAAASLEPKQVSNQLTTLKKKGFITSPARWKYEITEAGKAAL